MSIDQPQVKSPLLKEIAWIYNKSAKCIYIIYIHFCNFKPHELEHLLVQYPLSLLVSACIHYNTISIDQLQVQPLRLKEISPKEILLADV